MVIYQNKSMNFHESCRKKGWCNSKNGCPMSNILMDGSLGGKLFVPSDVYDTEFIPLYATALQNEENVYVIECRTEPLFKWHADIDLLLTEELSHSQLEQLVAVVGGSISEAECLSSPKPLLVLTNSPKEHKGYVKTGIHLVCPTLEVDVEKAIDIQKKSVEALSNTNIACKNEGGWEDAFDTSVYNGSGLRMFGSRKMNVCDCKKKNTESDESKETCQSCNGKGKVDAGRPYQLFGVWSTSGESMSSWKRTLGANVSLMCQKSSIRCLHSGGSLLQSKGKASRKITMARTQNRSQGRSATVFDKGILMKNICDDCPHVFSNLSVVSVTKYDEVAFLSVAGDSQRFCENVGRNHSNSNIYFMLKGTHLQQKCYCKKYECKHFYGDPIPLSSYGLLKLGVAKKRGLPPGFYDGNAR